MGHLVASQVPLVFTLFVAHVAIHPFTLGVNIDNVLFQIKFVAEDAVTYGTDAWLPAVPKPRNACPYQVFSVCKGRKNALSVWQLPGGHIPVYLSLLLGNYIELSRPSDQGNDRWTYELIYETGLVM